MSQSSSGPQGLTGLWGRFSRPPAPLLGHVILALLVLSETLVSVFWIFSFSGLGEAYAFMALFPYAYIVISYISLLFFHHFRHFDYSTFTQLSMLLVMPYFLQWVIGGFQASSGIAIWGVLSPVGALMILGTRQSTPWFLLFFGLAMVSWVLDSTFAGYALPIPQHTRDVFFLVNVCGTASILYFVMRFFDSQKERLMQALDETNRLVLLEQEKSDRLLLNILPKSIADRLKNKEGRIADSYDSATIMFADLVDFTQISAGMTPADLLELLNLVFSRFDELADKYGLEKIKTIGDAYMVVGGAPEPRPDHAEAMADLAIEMQAALVELSAISGRSLMMRIGINTGPVIAGVIGNSKFSYDLWGDTVNLASRMEHYGVSNAIQVSQATHELLRDKFSFEARGAIAVKGKGNVEAYLLTGRIALS